MIVQLTMRSAIVSGTLFASLSSHSQELNENALAYLHRHGVPCLHVTHVETPIRDFDMLATCDDGRQWALFFIEAEVAFVQPQSGEPYRWRREVFLSHPQVYGSAQLRSDASFLTLY